MAGPNWTNQPASPAGPVLKLRIGQCNKLIDSLYHVTYIPVTLIQVPIFINECTFNYLEKTGKKGKAEGRRRGAGGGGWTRENIKGAFSVRSQRGRLMWYYYLIKKLINVNFYLLKNFKIYIK